MAKREGQGLQIAVITFAMLTIMLAITTYIFYAQSQTAQKDLEAKTKALTEQQGVNNKLTYRVQAMKYVLGAGGVTKEDLEVAKSKAGGDDNEVKEVLDNFAQDVALVEQLAPEGPRNYRTLNTALATALQSANASAADANAQAREAQRQRELAEKTEKTRADEAKAAADKALADLDAERITFTAYKSQIDEEKNSLAAKVNEMVTKGKSELDKISKEKDKETGTVKQQQGRIQTLVEEVKRYQKDQQGLFENPDGHIVLVNQQQRLVWIDVGKADGLLRQTTFSVYDHDENGVAGSKPKARIEVVNLSDHMSEARILEDTPANPIINRDIIHTPSWSPGQRIHFALALKMDVNKDSIDDYEMVKNVILMNGGVIDAELRPDGTRVGNITVNTRYFVQGDKFDEKTPADTIKKFADFDKERANSGVEPIPVEKLLALMGWKVDERTVELAGNRGAGSFRPRAPGKTQPAAPAATPAADSPTSPAAARGAADPFAGAAPGVAPADPFAAPAAPRPAPAADFDPFATPPK